MYPREVSLANHIAEERKGLFFFLHIIKSFNRVFSKLVALILCPDSADWPQFEIPTAGLPGCLAAGDFRGQGVRPVGREAQPALPSMAKRAKAARAGLWLLQAPHMRFPCSPSRPPAAGEEAARNYPQVEGAAPALQ